MNYIACFCFSYAAAVFAAQYLLPLWLLLFAAAGCAVLGVLWSLTLRGEWRVRALLMGIGLAAGFLCDLGYVRRIYMPFEALSGTTRTLTLELTDYPTATDYGCKAEVRFPGSGLHGKGLWYGDESMLGLEPGTYLTGKVEIRTSARIRGQAVSSYTSQGIFALLYSRGPARTETGRANSKFYYPQHLSRRFREVIQASFPEKSQPLMKAVLLGDRTGLSEEDGTFLTESGLYHVTAVSGMHCAFLVSMLIFVIGRYYHRLLFWVSFFLLTFYALMVGMTPSVVRASIMILFSLHAPIYNRSSDTSMSMSVALFLILLVNPFAVKSLSLQLSFAAVAGLSTLSPRLYDRIDKWIWPPDDIERVKRRREKKPWKKLGRRAAWLVLASLATTAGALLFTLPLSAIYFNSLTLISPVSNLLCLWAVSLTFMSGLFTVLTGAVYPPAAAIMAYIPHAGAVYLLGVAEFLTRLPWHAAYFSNKLLGVWLVYAYALFGTCRLIGSGRARWITASALAALTLLLTLRLAAWRMNGSPLHVTALDIGQGQCVALYSQGAAALVDCGTNSYKNAGEIAADYLQSIGVNRLDYIVLSHYHSDHCNGLPVLLSRLKVGALLLPDIEEGDETRGQIFSLAERWGVAVVLVRETVRVELGEAVLTVFPPVAEGDMNEECLTALCTYGSFDALFTGDMDENTEYRLVTAYELPDVEVLMAGHHGSRYSTGGDLLAEVKPESCIVSCGEGNSYGHPHREALRRMADAGAEIYRTDRQGTVHIVVHNT